MKTQQALEKAKQLLQSWETECTSPEFFRCDFWVKVEDFSEIIQALTEAKWGYLSAITGVDRPAKDENQTDVIDMMYHFSEGEAVVTLHVHLPYDNLHIPTVCQWITSASIYEREAMEMLGVVIDDTPDTNKFVLPDEWPDGIYPLRKSFKGLTPDQINEAKA